MANIFKQVLLPKVDTNRFDLTHDVKMSFDMGEIIPTCALEALPGDRFKISVENMLRFAPLISPVMHRVRVTTHYFFVPNRLLWADWDQWITGNSDVLAPYIEIGDDAPTFEQGSIADYLGFPTQDAGPGKDNYRVTPMFHAAYRLIWDEYYRDQNLQQPRFVPLVSGNNVAFYGPNTDQGPYKRAWQHDYFTSCLPFAQKGDAVQVPLVTQNNIPVEFDTINPGTNEVPSWKNPFNGFDTPPGNVEGVTGPSETEAQINGARTAYDPKGTLSVDVQAGATDINTLRRAFRLQEWLERNARGGTRYVESILSHFGVKSPDARMQRPEYVGGSMQNMVISEVLATAQNDGSAVAVGSMAGHGISVGGGNTFTYTAKEHGILIGVINVQPDTAYQQGLHKQFMRMDRLDYAWPTFANLGEQPVLNCEVYYDHDSGKNTFGYIPRYSEYKYANSRVAGDMKTTLNFWHLGRIFANDPNLNSDFIECNPSKRIFAFEGDEDSIYSHIFNRISVIRKLPKFGIPTI